MDYFFFTIFCSCTKSYFWYDSSILYGVMYGEEEEAWFIKVSLYKLVALLSMIAMACSLDVFPLWIRAFLFLVSYKTICFYSLSASRCFSWRSISESSLMSTEPSNSSLPSVSLYSFLNLDDLELNLLDELALLLLKTSYWDPDWFGILRKLSDC